MSPLPVFLRGQRTRVLLGSITGLLAAGVVIGLTVAWLSTSVLEAAGLDTTGTTATADQTTAEPVQPSTTGSPEPAGTTSTPPTPVASPAPKAPTLSATPTTVATYEQVTLSGRFPGLAGGTALQIERRENGVWVLFPAGLTSDDGGGFSTYVQTGRPGENEFRVSVPSSALTTATVTVTVR